MTTPLTLGKFPHGSLARIAAKAGVSKQLVSHILTGTRRCSLPIAERLVTAAKELGMETAPFDWLNPDLTSNPLFKQYQ